jgi:hypothetical protein
MGRRSRWHWSGHCNCFGPPFRGWLVPGHMLLLMAAQRRGGVRQQRRLARRDANGEGENGEKIFPS